MRKCLSYAALALLLTGCCGGKKETVAATPTPVAVKTTPPTATTAVRPCSGMPTVGDCTACCGASFRSTFRGAGTCTCVK